MSQLSRRSFLGLAAASAASAAPAVFAKSVSVPAQWDEEADVLVVGSGFAGLGAAYECGKAGLKTVVFEKMPVFGGNSAIDGGEMTCVGAPQQVAKGIKDSIELWISDTLVAGNYMNYRDKVETLGRNMLPTYNWLKDEIGVRFSPNALVQDGGHSVPRSVISENGTGSDYIKALYARCQEKGVSLRNRSYVQSVIRDPASGRVAGLEVRTGYKFPDASSGKLVRIRAKKAVVLGHGGFAADVAYRSMQDPKLTDKFDITNQPGATGEMWREAARIGAAMIQVDWIQVVPWCSPYEKGMGILWTFSHSCAAPYGIWVDTSTGKRFVNELANRKVRADIIMALNNEGHTCIAVTDRRGAEQLEYNRPGTIGKMLECGGLVKFDTLEALAAKYGIPMGPLQEEIEGFNRNVRDKVQKDSWGKVYNADCTEMKNGPWYAAELMPKIHHCMGGMLTDVDCRVLDVSDNKPIPGLYGAGECCGGVHGAVRLGCNGILDCVVNGRIAGRTVVADNA